MRIFAVLAAVLALTACASQDSPPDALPAVRWPTVGDLPAPGTQQLPGGFQAVSALRCSDQLRAVPGDGKWFFRIEERADGVQAALLAALRRPDEAVPTDLICMDVAIIPPYFAPDHQHAVDACAEPFRRHDGRVLFLELQATQEERLRRNEGASRLAEKPSKRDLARSRANLLDLDERYQLDSAGCFDDRPDYLRLDNTHLAPADLATTVIAHFGLSEVSDVDSPTG
jgi:hypothetical protein